MTRSTFRVLFYANGSKEKNGIVPIMGRVTINGTVAQFSCKRSIAKELWDAKGNRAKGKSVEARETNLALDNIKAQIIRASAASMKRCSKPLTVRTRCSRNVSAKTGSWRPISHG